MALDERYIVASDLESYFVDKDSGLPLAGGTLTFFSDTSRITPKQVYQLSGSPPSYTYTAMPNPITLSSVGTVQNAGGDNEVIYYYPYDANGNIELYYIECRNSAGVEQFTREAWPNLTAGTDPTKDGLPVQNQLSNPQFSRVFINDNVSTVYTVTAATNQVFEFAPNWDFVISGTGTVTIQRIAISGNDNVVTSPPYVLDISVSSGVTACYLRQRLSVNSGLWASTDNNNIFLAGTLIARNENVGTTGIQMFYQESSGGSPVIIVDESFDNSGYQILLGGTASPIPQSTNTDLGDSGYVDIYLSFLTNSNVRISSIQVVPSLNSNSADLIQYQELSSNREQALMGDYYIPRLEEKRIPSVLVGWDFPLNPAQFGESGSVGTTAEYIWDQTIALRGASSNVTYARNSTNNALQFTTAGTDNAFYIMQYLSGDDVKKLIGSRLSVNVDVSKTAAGNDVTFRVYLCRAPNATAIPTLPTSVGTLTAGGASSGVFTVDAAGWTEIPRSGLGIPKGTVPVISSATDYYNDNSQSFIGWELTDITQIADTDKFAIVVTFAYPDSATVITVKSISLNLGDIPTRPAPQTADEVLRECQYYYEKSYPTDVYAGAATSNGERIFLKTPNISVVLGGLVNTLCQAFAYQLVYNTRKAYSPTLYFYDTAGTVNRVGIGIRRDGAWVFDTTLTQDTAFIARAASEASIWYEPASSTTVISSLAYAYGDQNIIFFNYVADARLGKI